MKAAAVVRLTLPHRYDFEADSDIVGDDLLRPEAWDSLRLKTSGPFSIASDRDELERQADAHPEVGERMKIVDDLLRERDARRLVSYGVGGAVPELWLLRVNPALRLTLTDFAPETVERLQRLLPEAQIRAHNLLCDPPLAGDVHLFHRIDTELDNRQWRGVYERFAGRTIVVVATEVVSGSEIPRRLWTNFRHRGVTRAGWSRTAAAFEALWRRTHRGRHLDLLDLEGWVLDPR
jgi:hypothetical protein